METKWTRIGPERAHVPPFSGAVSFWLRAGKIYFFSNSLKSCLCPCFFFFFFFFFFSVLSCPSFLVLENVFVRFIFLFCGNVGILMMMVLVVF